MLRGIAGLVLLGLSAMSKSDMQKRLDWINKEDDRLREELRSVIYAREPDEYFEWTAAQQDAYDQAQDARRDRIKRRREELDEEGIRLDHEIRRRRR